MPTIINASGVNGKAGQSVKLTAKLVDKNNNPLYLVKL
ncbi:hypothetical protein ALNOE001_20350 [Candidatus Methanobinarius endosymbioticus]|uniref:Uncharacterized protein n=1 Tax=Candidatus Methanobinarius endosymbioticus TaxID=2006182 RepID=A0A366M800_9EURY|nr:hypothetical protein ALNOE001_20350 [Candidatus Methanobinarius endosymbioticus]